MPNSQHQRQIERANAGLVPVLGLFTTTMLVIGGVIGSGIFRKPGIMAAQVGSPELLLGVWVLAGVITLIGALTNAEVAADVAEKCVAGGGRWIALVVMISTFGATNAIILASARVYFAMARRRMFPAFLGSAHPRFHTPAASLVVQGVWSVLLLFSGTFDTLTDTLIFVSWIFYGASAYGVIVLRRKEPDTARPFRVPFYPWLPWVFVLFSAAFLALTIYNDVSSYRTAAAAGKPALINCAFGAALVLAGAPVYWFYRARRRSDVARHSDVEPGDS